MSDVAAQRSALIMLVERYFGAVDLMDLDATLA